MTPSRIMLLLAAIAVSAAGCGRVSNPAPSPAPSPARASPQAVAPPSLHEAFRLAFGKPAPARRDVARDGEHGETLIYDPAELIPFGGGYALVSLGHNLSDCHVCAGAMAIHYLRRGSDGRWTATGAWPEILYGNGFGEPPRWRLRADLGVSAMIQSETGWSGQGYSCGSADLVELAPDGPKLRAEDIPLHYDDAGAVGDDRATVVDGEIAQGPHGGLRVTYKGSRAGVVDYALKDGRFSRVAGPADIAAC